jgi:hypothetical protein
MAEDRNDGNKKRRNLHAALVHATKEEVDLRLAQLGWSRAPFIQAAVESDLMRRSCTHMDAPGVPGYYVWSRGYRVMNDELCAKHGTHPGLYLQIPVAYDVDEMRAIAVSSGDSNTGRLGDDPSTKNIKGSATIEALAGNRKLPFGRDLSDEEYGVDFWYSLIDANDDGIWIEISRPTTVDRVGHVEGWSERIVIGRVDLGGGGGRKRTKPQTPPSTGDAIDVPVSRKRTA